MDTKLSSVFIDYIVFGILLFLKLKFVDFIDLNAINGLKSKQKKSSDQKKVTIYLHLCRPLLSYLMESYTINFTGPSFNRNLKILVFLPASLIIRGPT